MTIKQAVETAKEFCPSVYDEEKHVQWLSQLDWKIKREIVDKHVDADRISFVGYDETTPKDTLLIAPPPYDEMYIHYLCAQVCFFNGEFARYQAYMSMHNSIYSSYAAWYNENNGPIRTIFKFFGGK